jgi:hypothetical protein
MKQEARLTKKREESDYFGRTGFSGLALAPESTP